MSATRTIAKNRPKRVAYDGATVSARFDNARHTPDMMELFRGTDNLAATNSLNPAVRKTTRERARYVVANVPYAGSMVDTFVTHVVGPWASVSFPASGIADDLRRRIVDDFDAWAMASDFWFKVRTMLRAKIVDGESFAVFTTDNRIVNDLNRVSLNIRVLECERVQSYTDMITRENEFDGIRFDANCHPLQYRILKYHPGDYRQIRNIQFKAGEWTDAKNVIHYFDVKRPEQVRGISDFVSALDIPALQKSYREAVAQTAITAASISGILHTNQVPECYGDDGTSLGHCAMDVKPNTVFKFQHGSFVTAPEGWDITQLQAEQPTTLYADFVRSLVAEMASCLCMPVNIAMCDSSQHNFASAKLDHMTYGDKIGAVRSALSVVVLDRVFFAWLEEYAAINGLSREVVLSLRRTEWLFKESANSDVMKDASADNTRLMNGTATYESICGKRGLDVRRFIETGIDERITILRLWRDKCKAAGLPEDTPCPYVTLKSDAPKAAPTEDELEHDTQKQPQTADDKGKEAK